jgi:lysophospholipase L1-like esterase
MSTAIWMTALGAPVTAQEASPSLGDGLVLVGLGDSLPGALGCEGLCRSYVPIYGEMAAEALGTPVRTTNLATNDGLVSGILLDRVTADPVHREALAVADLITVQIGLNDWQGECMWGDLAECLANGAATAAGNLDAVLDEFSVLRGDLPTAVRVVTYFDPYVGTAQAPEWWGFDPADREAFEAEFATQLTDFNAMLCRVAADHDATCVDTRTPFNGPGWDIEAVPEPADGALVLGGDDHLHMTAAGHQLVAQAIAEAGFAPLAETSSQGSQDGSWLVSSHIPAACTNAFWVVCPQVEGMHLSQWRMDVDGSIQGPPFVSSSFPGDRLEPLLDRGLG